MRLHRVGGGQTPICICQHWIQSWGRLRMCWLSNTPGSLIWWPLHWGWSWWPPTHWGFLGCFQEGWGFISVQLCPWYLPACLSVCLSVYLKNLPISFPCYSVCCFPHFLSLSVFDVFQSFADRQPTIDMDLPSVGFCFDNGMCHLPHACLAWLTAHCTYSVDWILCLFANEIQALIESPEEVTNVKNQHLFGLEAYN